MLIELAVVFAVLALAVRELWLLRRAAREDAREDSSARDDSPR